MTDEIEDFTQEFKFKDKDFVSFDSYGLQGHGYVRGYSSVGIVPIVIVEVTLCNSPNGSKVPSELYPFSFIGVPENYIFPIKE